MGKSQTTTIVIDGLGEVRLARRAGMSRLRLTVTPRGPLLSMPWYTPRVVALSFLSKHRDWLQANLHAHQTAQIAPGAQIGKTHSVRFVFTTGAHVTTRTARSMITVAHPRSMTYDDPRVQAKAQQAAIKVLKNEAERFLPKRLALLANQHGFTYAEVKVRRMTSRWGSCSSTKLITLNIFLMQLPDYLIDYVLIHELVHTVHLDHSAEFWRTFERALPGAKQLRKSIKARSPVLQPTYPFEEPSVSGNGGSDL